MTPQMVRRRRRLGEWGDGCSCLIAQGEPKATKGELEARRELAHRKTQAKPGKTRSVLPCATRAKSLSGVEIEGFVSLC